jgi:hypothetical protein
MLLFFPKNNKTDNIIVAHAGYFCFSPLKMVEIAKKTMHTLYIIFAQ